MLRKIWHHLLSFKHGLLILFLVLAIVIFLLGVWVGSKDDLLSFVRSIPVNEEESLWQEQGLLFNDGVYFVGSEIKPGIYRTKGTDVSLYGCTWQRLSGFGAENNNILVDYHEDSGLPTIVAIPSSDKGFKTRGCGKWYAESIPIAENPTSFGDGAFIVGVDIWPGVYKSSAQKGCYWERLSGLSRNFYSGRLLGQDQELIARSNDTIIEITNTDKGFISKGCDKWIKQEA